MAKHKARFWEHPAAYVPGEVRRAREDFLVWVGMAQLTADWYPAIEGRMRGRVGTRVRAWSDRLKTGHPKKWW